MKNFWDIKHGYDGDKPTMDGSMNAMKVGELLGGHVLYQPKRGMNPEGCEQDVLRLSCALDIVMRQAVKNKVKYSVSKSQSMQSFFWLPGLLSDRPCVILLQGLLLKSGSKRDKLKERHVDVDGGQFTFSEVKGGGKLRKQIEMDAMQKVRSSPALVARVDLRQESSLWSPLNPDLDTL